MQYVRFLLLVLLFGSIPTAIVILISKIEKNRTFLKYLPTIILFATGVMFIITAKRFSQGMEGLGYIALAMIAIGCCVLTLTTAIVIDVLRKKQVNNSSLNRDNK